MDLFGRVVRREGKEEGQKKFRKINLMVSPSRKLSVGYSPIIQDVLHKIHTSHWDGEEKGIGERGKYKDAFCHHQITLQLFLRPEFLPGYLLLQVRAMSPLSFIFHVLYSLAESSIINHSC